jgi:SPP1 family phage portal protein
MGKYIDIKIEPFKEQLTTNKLFTTADYKKFVDVFRETNLVRFTALREYRDGKSIIDDKTMNNQITPNHKVKANFCKMITDTAVGYFMGVGVKWSTADEEIAEVIDAINSSNNVKTHDYEMSMHSSIYGVAYELHWRDADAHFRFNVSEPEQTFVVRSADVEKNIVLGFRLIQVNDKEVMIEVYTDANILRYLEKGKDWLLIDDKLHTLARVPITENFNNLFKASDFEPALTLIEAYNVSLSNTSNDVEAFTDAYLVLKGYDDTKQDELKQVLQQKVFNLTADGSVEFLTKSTNDTQHENYRNRLVKNIHETTQIPNLTSDEFVSSISGVALRLKMQSLDQLTSEKEMFYRKTLKHRLVAMVEHMELLNKVKEKNIKVDSTDFVDITFYKNIPQNLVEISEMVNKLIPIVSEETLLSQLPFIDDANVEMERKAKEREADTNLLTSPFVKAGETDEKETKLLDK